jgi:hypothetical protein
LSDAASDRREGFNGLARVVAERLHELGVPLDGLIAPAPREHRNVLLDQRIALGDAKRRGMGGPQWSAERSSNSPPGWCNLTRRRPGGAHEAEAIIPAFTSCTIK